MNSSGLVVEHSSGSLIEEKSLFFDNGDGFGDEGAAGEMIDNLLQDENTLLEDIYSNKETSLPAELPSSIIVEPGNSDDQCLPEDEKVNETTSSNEEEGFTLDPIDGLVRDIAERRKNKKRRLLIDPVKEISSKTMHKQLTSFVDTLMVLDLAPPTQRLMMWKKRGGVDTLLSTATQDLIHDELKKLFANCFLSSDLKLAKLIQKESVRKEVGTKNILESSVIEEPNSHGELDQLQVWNDVTDGSTGSFQQDITMNINSEDIFDMASPAAEGLSSINASVAQENCPVELESSVSKQNTEAEKWNQRLFQTLNELREYNKMGMQSFSLIKLCRNCDRKQTAAKFYTFLILKKHRVIELSQSVPYADIIATVGPMFHKM